MNCTASVAMHGETLWIVFVGVTKILAISGYFVPNRAICNSRVLPFCCLPLAGWSVDRRSRRPTNGPRP